MFVTGYVVHDLRNSRLRFVKSPQQAPGHQIWGVALLHASNAMRYAEVELNPVYDCHVILDCQIVIIQQAIVKVEVRGRILMSWTS